MTTRGQALKQVFSYERTPYRTELEVEVLEVRVESDRPCVLLDDTILYPEGGGQPCDFGWLGDVRIEEVRRRGGEILHYPKAGEVKAGKALLRLDWKRRYDHMQQHTAQHLLSALALERFGWRTRAFHLAERVCDIDLDVADPSPREVESLEEAVAGQVAAAKRVRIHRVSREDYGKLEVRSRGLPAGHTGDIRLVEIEGVDLNTCGGTHVGLTSEIGAVKILKVEPQRGGSRLFWVAGGRLRRRLGHHETRTAELKALLDTADEELVRVCRLKLEQLAEGKRRQRLLEERMTGFLVSRLLDDAESLVEYHLDGVEASLLRRVLEEIGRSDARRLVFLTSEGPEGALFALKIPAKYSLDARKVGQQLCEILDGRGGGSGEVFQGKAATLARRAEAVALLGRVNRASVRV